MSLFTPFSLISSPLFDCVSSFLTSPAGLTLALLSLASMKLFHDSNSVELELPHTGIYAASSNKSGLQEYATDVIKHVHPKIIKPKKPSTTQTTATEHNNNCNETNAADSGNNDSSSGFSHTKGPGTNSSRGTCLIIYTGGTIGMKRNSAGHLAPTSGYLLEMLRSMPELQHPDVPNYDLIEWNKPVDSSDFSPALWIQLAKQIEENYYNYDGFVILHGTDTMAYTASALSFMLENLNKTVILTGSMIPLSAPVSDAKRNLIISLMCSVNLDIPEVCIFFNNALYRGNRSKKLDPISTNAFDSPNFPPLAEMGVHIAIRRDLILPSPKRRFQMNSKLFCNIAVFSLVPGFDDVCINAFVSTSTPDKPVAMILQLYGAGNAPANKKGFIAALENATAAGCVVVATSQCLRGSVDMSQYATGHALLRLGVIDGRDMTVESCVTKLSHLMGIGLRGRELKQAMESNWRGELTVQQAQEYSTNEHNANLVEALIKGDSTRIQQKLTPATNSNRRS